jgi:hypothetical protein
MKKTIYIIMALLLATNVYAQVVDQEKLQKFIVELKALNGEHVTCVNENSGSDTYLEYPSDFLVLEVNGQNMSVTGLETSDTTFRYVSVMSEDNIGYNLINGVFEKYYDEESEDIFGIPLMACQREDGEQESIFICEGHTLLVRDSGDDVMILYATMNIMERVQDAMRSVMEMTTEDFVDVDMFGGMDFGVHTNMDALSKHPDNPYCPSADGESIMALARKIFNDNTELLESRLAKAESEEEREELTAEIAAFKEEAKESLDDLEKELADLKEKSEGMTAQWENEKNEILEFNELKNAFAKRRKIINIIEAIMLVSFIIGGLVNLFLSFANVADIKLYTALTAVSYIGMVGTYRLMKNYKDCTYWLIPFAMALGSILFMVIPHSCSRIIIIPLALITILLTFVKKDGKSAWALLEKAPRTIKDDFIYFIMIFVLIIGILGLVPIYLAL